MGAWNGYCWIMLGIVLFLILVLITVLMRYADYSLRYAVEIKLLWRIVLGLNNTVIGLKNYAINLREHSWMKSTLKVDREFAETQYNQTMKDWKELIDVNPVYDIPEKRRQPLNLEPTKSE